jgi:Mn2+/Fe2+ NRAMP family transporter
LNAFLKSLSGLLQGVYLFSVVIIFASLNSVIAARKEPNAVTSYETVTSTLVSIFTICLVILMYKSSEAAKLLQLAVILVLWVVMLGIVNLGRDRNPKETAMEADTFGHPFEIYCPVLGNG